MEYTKGDCRFYRRSGKCGSEDAPNRNHSWCIDVNGCGSFEYLNSDARNDMYEACNNFICNINFVKVIDERSQTLLGVLKHDIEKALNKAKEGK